MHNADLYPAGRVLWAMRNNDLHETHRSPPDPQSTGSAEGTKLRLFEVLDVDKIFSQVLFAKDMLRFSPCASVASHILMIISIVPTCPILTTAYYTIYYRPRPRCKRSQCINFGRMDIVMKPSECDTLLAK